MKSYPFKKSAMKYLPLFQRSTTRSLLGALVVLVHAQNVLAQSQSGVSGSSAEMDSHLPSEEEESRPSGLDSMYGGVSIAKSAEESEAEESSFGLGRMYGGVSGAAGIHGQKRARQRRNLPEFHVVKKGDTLWALSQHYYGSPWAWPQVWSLNPQVENPHWIYPGDQIRTSRGTTKSEYQRDEDSSAGPGGFVGRAAKVPGGTVFVRDQGYLGDPERDVWG